VHVTFIRTGNEEQEGPPAHLGLDGHEGRLGSRGGYGNGGWNWHGLGLDANHGWLLNFLIFLVLLELLLLLLPFLHVLGCLLGQHGNFTLSGGSLGLNGDEHSVGRGRNEKVNQSHSRAGNAKKETWGWAAGT
jgi:hypothetical protein